MHSTTPFGPEKIRPDLTSGTPEDEQANDFACAILMPEEAFRRLFAEQEGNIFKIARHFEVPFSAVIRRAGMLRLVEEPYEGAHDRWDP